MGALTESEIFDCLSSNFRLAASLCEDLARLPAKGPSYNALRKSLKLIEGAARQASAWREDSRWLRVGLMAASYHKLAGNWLRGEKTGGVRVTHGLGGLHARFTRLAEVMRAGLRATERMRTQATGRVGMILPTPQPGPHRDTRPVGWSKTDAGILIPNTLQ